MRALCLAVVGLFVFVSSAAVAADFDITKDAQRGIKDCAGGTATILSNKNQLTFKNCKKVVVTGNKNKLVLEGCTALEVPGNSNTVKAGRIASINTMGNKNRVRYQLGPKKEKPKISNLGKGNRITAEK